MNYYYLDKKFIEKEFTVIYEKVKDISVNLQDKLYNLWQFANLFKGGIAAEFGVWRGGSAKLIHDTINGEIHLFDTFAGLPQGDENDILLAGEFSNTSLEQVQDLLNEYDNVFFYEGLFESIEKPDIKYDFVHIDSDLYYTIIDALNYFYPRMNQFGVILLDDYCYPNCPGVIKAVKEFMADKQEKCINLCTYQGVIIKK